VTITSTHIAEVLDAVAQLAMATFVGLGVLVAYNQLTAWRSEHLSKRKSEISEKLLATAYKAQRAISATRSLMENVPADVANKHDAIIQIKWERLKSFDDVFDVLQELQVLHEALTGNLKIKAALEEIFDARHTIYVALSSLQGWELDHRSNESDQKFYQEQKMIMYGSGSAKYDMLSPKVTKAIETLRSILLPEIRMDKEK